MRQVLMLFSVLFISWVVFSGYVNIFFLSCGLISCAIAVYYAQKMDAVGDGRWPIHLKPKAWVYYVWLVKEIVPASFDVAKRVWQPKPSISPTLDWIKSSQGNHVGKSLYANSITLTPGTVCVEVDGDDMCVHGLIKEGVEDLKTGRMDGKVTKVTG